MESETPWRDEATLRDALDHYDRDELAEEWDCSDRVIRNWMNRFGIEVVRTDSYADHPVIGDRDELERLYHGEGLNQRQIADRTDVPQQSVSRWLDRHGIEKRRRDEAYIPELRNPDYLRELHHERKLDQHEIAELLGVSVDPVHTWFHRYGIEVRRSGEYAPNYIDGRSEHVRYGDGWTRQRRRALERDEYRCRRCGIANDEHLTEYGFGLDVHHVEPFDPDEPPEPQHQLANLVTFCRGCHMEKHTNQT